MTPENWELDKKVLFSQSSILLYRLARKKLATLSGTGAAIFPGRWNQTGEKALYTSVEQGTTVLERLVHTPKDAIPSDLAIMRIRITGAWSPSPIGVRDAQTGAEFWALPSLSQARQVLQRIANLAGSGFRPFAIALPSVIVPVWNVVLYPAETGFSDHVTLEGVEPFEFDARLFPDDAALER